MDSQNLVFSSVNLIDAVENEPAAGSMSLSSSSNMSNSMCKNCEISLCSTQRNPEAMSYKRHAGVASANSCEPSRSAMFSVITFRVSRRRREMYSGHARLCVCVCVSAAACGCNFAAW